MINRTIPTFNLLFDSARTPKDALWMIKKFGGVFSGGVNGTYIDEKGYIKKSDGGIPRVHYNPETLECDGVLFEWESTNLFAFNNNADTLWASNTLGASVTEHTSESALIEGVKMWKLVADSTGSQMRIEVAWEKDETTSFSVFLKKDTTGYASIGIYDSGSPEPYVNRWCHVDLINGELSDNLFDRSSIQKFPNGWYRVSVTGKAPVGSGTSGIKIALSNGKLENMDVTPNATVGNSILFTGIQREHTSAPTSFIPTNGASVTRSRDSLSFPSFNVFNPSKGTFNVSYKSPLDSSDKDNHIFSANDGTEGNRIDILDNIGGGIRQEIVESSTKSVDYTTPYGFDGVREYDILNLNSLPNGSVTESTLNIERTRGSGTLSIVPFGDGQNKMLRIGNMSGNAELWASSNIKIPLEDNKIYRYEMIVRRKEGTPSVSYSGFTGVASDGVTLVNVNGLDSTGSQHYLLYSGSILPTNFRKFSSDIISTNVEIHENVVFMRPMFMLNYNVSNAISDILSFKVIVYDNESLIAKYEKWKGRKNYSVSVNYDSLSSDKFINGNYINTYGGVVIPDSINTLHVGNRLNTFQLNGMVKRVSYYGDKKSTNDIKIYGRNSYTNEPVVKKFVFQGVFDLFGVAELGLSTRLLRRDYSGGLIEAVAEKNGTQYGTCTVLPYRVSKNEYRIDLNSPIENFVENPLQSRSLPSDARLGEFLDFGGQNYNGKVQTIYNQGSAGAAGNMVRTNLSTMPPFAIAGELLTLNGKPTISDGGQYNMTSSYTLTAITEYFISSVIKARELFTSSLIGDNIDGGIYALISESSSTLTLVNNSCLMSVTKRNKNAYDISTKTRGDIYNDFSPNLTLLSTIFKPTSPFSNFVFGYRPTSPGVIFMYQTSEFILGTNATNKDAIEANQYEYFGIS